MRRTVAAVAAAMLLLITPACGGVQVGFGAFGGFNSFDAFVTQPISPFVVVPGQSFIIIVELIPIDGVILGGPVFFNDFIGVNPNLAFACPSILTFGSPALGPSAFGTAPSIAIPISPIGFGSCTIPIHVGTGGIFFLNVSVATAAASRTGYTVTIRSNSHRVIDSNTSPGRRTVDGKFSRFGASDGCCVSRAIPRGSFE